MTLEKRCKVCKVPVTGMLHKYITKPLFGIERSKEDEELCNKCDAKKNGVL